MPLIQADKRVRRANLCPEHNRIFWGGTSYIDNRDHQTRRCWANADDVDLEAPDREDLSLEMTLRTYFFLARHGFEVKADYVAWHKITFPDDPAPNVSNFPATDNAPNVARFKDETGYMFGFAIFQSAYDIYEGVDLYERQVDENEYEPVPWNAYTRDRVLRVFAETSGRETNYFPRSEISLVATEADGVIARLEGETKCRYTANTSIEIEVRAFDYLYHVQNYLTELATPAIVDRTLTKLADVDRSYQDGDDFILVLGNATEELFSSSARSEWRIYDVTDGEPEPKYIYLKLLSYFIEGDAGNAIIRIRENALYTMWDEMLALTPEDNAVVFNGGLFSDGVCGFFRKRISGQTENVYNARFHPGPDPFVQELDDYPFYEFDNSSIYSCVYRWTLESVPFAPWNENVAGVVPKYVIQNIPWKADGTQKIKVNWTCALSDFSYAETVVLVRTSGGDVAVGTRKVIRREGFLNWESLPLRVFVEDGELVCTGDFDEIDAITPILRNINGILDFSISVETVPEVTDDGEDPQPPEPVAVIHHTPFAPFDFRGNSSSHYVGMGTFFKPDQFLLRGSSGDLLLGDGASTNGFVTGGGETVADIDPLVSGLMGTLADELKRGLKKQFLNDPEADDAALLAMVFFDRSSALAFPPAESSEIAVSYSYLSHFVE